MEPLKILAVDDDAVNLKLIQYSLENLGYEVDGFLTGKMVKEVEDLDYYDVFVIDIMMPYMDGCEVCRYLQEKGARGKRIAHTAKSKWEDADLYLNNGFHEFLPKPANKDLFRMVISAATATFECVQCLKIIRFGEGHYDTDEGVICCSCKDMSWSG